MFTRRRNRSATPVAGLLVAATAATAAVMPATPASAQFLDFFFGSFRRAGPPGSASAYADPGRQNLLEQSRERRGYAGAAVAYCVRLCDGRFFPIQRSHDSNAAEICSAFCPAAETRLFFGGKIDYASAKDGTRYSALENAFVYRERLVEGCTCNGRDAFGLANRMTAADDPTLRKGDIVATNQGFVAYQGGQRQHAEFTPIESYRGLSADWQRKLAETEISPSPATPVSPDTIREGLAASRRVQLER